MTYETSKPRASSQAEMATLLVSAYTAAKTTEIAQSNQALVQNTNELLEIGKRMERSQANASRLFESIDFGIRNLEISAKETEKQAERATQLQEKMYLQQAFTVKRDKWRDERDQLEKQIAQEERAYEQNLKDLLHRFSRRLQLLSDSEMTTLELFFYTKQMLHTVEGIPADHLKDISDKKYRDEVEDELKLATTGYYAELNEQDISDLAMITEIERVDENQKASKLLALIEKKLGRFSKLNDLQLKVMKFESDGISEADFLEFEGLCAELEKDLLKR